MEHVKLSLGAQITLGVITLATALLNFKGCENLGYQKELSDARLVNRIQSDSMLTLALENKILDSLQETLKLSNAKLKRENERYREQMDSVRKTLKKMLEALNEKQ